MLYRLERKYRVNLYTVRIIFPLFLEIFLTVYVIGQYAKDMTRDVWDEQQALSKV